MMGKKQVVQEKEEDVIKESEKIKASLSKEVKVKSSQRVTEGRVYISSSYNNTILTLTDSKGRVLAAKSAGAVGFKGTKKATSFAASRVAEVIANLSKKLGMVKIEVFIKGVGAGRESSIRTLVGHGLNIVSIKDVTPIPHNGCRPKKVRRV